jgi:hypothetical protein
MQMIGGKLQYHYDGLANNGLGYDVPNVPFYRSVASIGN